MRHFLFAIMNRVGTLLTHEQRRFLLDRLGFARLVGILARNDFREAQLSSGASLFLNPLLHAHMVKNGLVVYEERVLQAVREHLQPGDVFYDVGANVGIFSFSAAGVVGEAGSVHAFEPEENNLACFRKSLEQSEYGNIVLHDYALGVQNRSMTFDRRGGAHSGRLVESATQSRGAVINVDVRSIDALIEEGLSPPTLIKVDVEGGEVAVFEGMRRTLERFAPAVICELHFFNPEGVRGTIDVLKDCGYACRTLDGTLVTIGDSNPCLPRHILATAE